MMCPESKSRINIIAVYKMMLTIACYYHSRVWIIAIIGDYVIMRMCLYIAAIVYAPCVRNILKQSLCFKCSLSCFGAGIEFGFE